MTLEKLEKDKSMLQRLNSQFSFLNSKSTKLILVSAHRRENCGNPLDYQSFVWLMEKSYFILTDSGGIQEEAPSLGQPVLVLREVTERPEAVEAGTVKFLGLNKNEIFQETQKLLNDEIEYEKMSRAVNPYGDGKASKRIVEILADRC